MINGSTDEGRDNLVEIIKGLSDCLISNLTLIVIGAFGSANLTVLEAGLQDSMLGVESMTEIWKSGAGLSSILPLPFFFKRSFA